MKREVMKGEVYIFEDKFVVIAPETRRCYLFDISEVIEKYVLKRKREVNILQGRLEEIRQDIYLVGYKCYFSNWTDYDRIDYIINTEREEVVIDYSHADSIHNKKMIKELYHVYSDCLFL